MISRVATGLITPPYTSARMHHYSPSSKSDATVADLCAQTVCFLWFESLPTLHEAATSNYPHHTRIPDIDSVARPEFIKWTRDVLSTTQVSINVVILAMLFIYRLKIANPTVKGKAGSEYRLMTVALMLGNKFLDDNTYTNKTWADVTSISVKEIHLMEVEFLSNMRYQLMVTVEEWQQWLNKINLFVRYQQKQQNMCYPASLPIGLPSPPIMSEYAPFNPALAGYRYQSTVLNPLQGEPRGRKRSIGDAHIQDAHGMLPPYKRLISQPSTPQRGTNMMLRPRPRMNDLELAPELSPSRRQTLQASFLRTMPAGKMQLHPSYPSSQPQSLHSGQSNSVSPTHLQVSTHPSAGSSPTTSSISQYSCHSRGPSLGYSPTSLAMQQRNSPYAPVQPVQRLVGRYQPIFNSSQMHSDSKEYLWYSQLSAGNARPVYNGHVPLSLQDVPYEYRADR